ncbi:class II aldolase/adducin family protein [Haloimpatiens massiliensis]|uniref:class II aldolase/adducin family protein n=1 Tax=Haloimpatiens massiliensis TaxID=1658110 RepID=UPI000C823045|nr:class II aldolase/adducin family protein [Haloimpatiens massiliensis]
MLEELKKKVVEIAREADKSGLCKHKSGNFSIRDKESGYVVITPSGVAREKLTYRDVCVIDLDANVIEMETNLRPSSEVMMHLEAYKARPDINAVVHTHSRFATSFAVLRKEIPAVVYESMSYGGTVPVASYGRPGTRALAESVIEPLKKSNACLLESHGVVAVAENIDDALLNAHYVEEIAEVYFRALLINGGKEPNVLPQDELQSWAYPSEINFDKVRR